MAEISGSLPNHTFCLKGDVTVTPILPESIQNALPVMPRSTHITADSLSMVDSSSTITDNCLVKKVNLISTLETVTSPSNLQPKSELERNSVTITPTSLATLTPYNVTDASVDNPEKITLTIKKSECVPNEMVVVGSLRHVEEQKKSVSPSEVLLGKQQLQKTITTVVSIVPKTNSTISTSSRVTSMSTSPSSNQLAILGKNSSVAMTVNNCGLSRPLVNIAPKPSVVNCTKSPVINTSKPLTAIKPKIISEREILPNVKLAASTCVPKVTDTVGHESTIKSVKQTLPLKNVLNRPAPVTTNKQGENSEIIFEKEVSIKQPLKINSPVGPPKPSGNGKLPAPKQPMKAKQVTVLKQSPNMKQIIINKPSPKGTLIGRTVVTKPLGTINEKLPGVRQGSPLLSSSIVKQGVTKPCQNVRPVLSSKSVGANSPPVSATISTTDAQPNKPTEKVYVAGKSVENAVLKPKNIIKNKEHPKVILQRHPASSSPNECQKHMVPNQLPGNKILNGPKKLKKKLGRPPDSSHYNGRSSSNKIDTELGYNEKQHIAHGVLLTLLKVTSHLPMVEFSDALETFEILTDAFRLNHKVSLSIKHDEEDDVCSSSKYDYYTEEIKSEEKDFRVTSTTDDDKLAVSQIDGQFDNMEFLKEFTSFQDVSPVGLKVMPVLVDDMQMDVEENSHLQIENRLLVSERTSNYEVCKEPVTFTLKRSSSEIEVSNSFRKRLKR